MKKKLFLLPLTILLSLGVVGCNSSNASFDSDTDSADIIYGYLGINMFEFYNFKDFDIFYTNFKEYNEYRFFVPDNLETFEYVYLIFGIADVRESNSEGTFTFKVPTVYFEFHVYSGLFSLDGYLNDISELNLTNDKEFTYTISEGKTSYQYTLNVYYDENVIYVGTITCLDEEEDHFEEINENINLIVEEFYNGTFSTY